MVACVASNIAIARQYLVKKQKISDPRFGKIEAVIVIFGQGLGQWVHPPRVGPLCDTHMKQTENQGKTDMGKFYRAVFTSAALLCASPLIAPAAHADIEQARDLMEDGKFEQAMTALLPAARSGNADAEELIGVMYAMGLGVARDDVRAFDWYLRSAMKGHPGAQSGVGWYYEVGRGMPKPDLVRAYAWYVLSAIGGDPDAAISQEEVVKKMTPAQIDQAHLLIDDYRTWLYPFR